MDENKKSSQQLSRTRLQQRKKRSASLTPTSKIHREDVIGDVVDNKDAADKTCQPSYKKKKNNVVDDANGRQSNPVCEDETEGPHNSVAVSSFSSSSSDVKSTSSSSSSSNVVVVAIPKNTTTSLRTKIIANMSNSHGVGNTGYNMTAIVEKVQRLALDHDNNEKRKKPFPYYYEFRSSTGALIMNIPATSELGIAEFRKLDSFSHNINITALGRRLEVGTDNGKRAVNMDGFTVKRVDKLLFADDIGFPNEEAKLLGQQVAREYKERVSGHFSRLLYVSVDMSIGERAMLVPNGSTTIHGLLKSLTEEERDRTNAFIAGVFTCGEDAERSSYRGPDVLQAQNQISANMNAVAIAMVKTGLVNNLRVGCADTTKNARRTTISRHLANGSKITREIGLFRVNPDTGTQHAVDSKTRKLVGREFSIMNFVIHKCVTFRDINEQRDCYVKMFNAVHKMDIAFWVRRLYLGDATVNILEFLFDEEEVFDTPVAWLLGH